MIKNITKKKVEISYYLKSLIVKRETPSFFALVVGIHLYSSTKDNHSTAELFIHFPFALPESIRYRSSSDTDSNQHVYLDRDYIFFTKRENKNFKKFYLIFIAEIKRHIQSLQFLIQIILGLGKLTEFLDLREYLIEWKEYKLQKLSQSLKCSFVYFLHIFQCLSVLSSLYDRHITHHSRLLIGGEK